MSYVHQVFDIPDYSGATELYQDALFAAHIGDEREAREKAYRQAIADATARAAPGIIAAAWYYLAYFLAGENDQDGALQAFAELLAAEASSYGAASPELGGTWHNIALFVADHHDAAVAECCERIALTMTRHVSRMSSHAQNERTGASAVAFELHQMIIILWKAGACDRMFRWSGLETELLTAAQRGTWHRLLGHALDRVGRYADAAASHARAVAELGPSDDLYLDALVGQAEALVDASPLHAPPPADVLAVIRERVIAALPAGTLGGAAKRGAFVLAACGSDLDVPLVIAASLENPYEGVRPVVKLLARRGVTAVQMHDAMMAVTVDGPSAVALRSVAVFELEHGFDALPLLRLAVASGNGELTPRLALLALDTGDLALLTTLANDPDQERWHALLLLIIAVAAVEASPSEVSFSLAVQALQAYVTAWRARSSR